MEKEKMDDKWNGSFYDSKIDYVSTLGKGVIEWLKPQLGERIMDLGCGTGELANEISASGASVLGMDLSSSMIETAKQKFPHLSFQVADGETFHTSAPYDAVFSNAALHWMKRPKQVIRSVRKALREGGRFVAEFGGKGNVQTIVKATEETLAARGVLSIGEKNPWYFPSIGEYATLLEQEGFHVAQAIHFARPTTLTDGEEGLKNWLHCFSNNFFADFSLKEKESAWDEIIEKCRPSLYRQGIWVADYWRIRITAIKLRHNTNIPNRLKFKSQRPDGTL